MRLLAAIRAAGTSMIRRTTVISSMSKAPSRRMMSTDSRTVWLNEAVVTLLTKLPPATPGTLWTSPPVTSEPSASRTVGRLTPNSSASCVSGGSLSPGRTGRPGWRP